MKSTCFSIVICILLTALICVIGTACSAVPSAAQPEAAAETAAVQATPEPTEEPVIPVIAVLSGDVPFEEISPYFEGIGNTEVADASEGLPDHTAAAFFYLSGEEDLTGIESMIERGIPVVVYNRIGAEIPEDAVEIGYSTVYGTDPESVMEDAIAYPPHDTPVRMFGVFTSEDTEASKIFVRMQQEGKVLSKGRHYGPADEDYSAWISRKLDTFIEGMVDCAYVETAELALILAEGLAERNRSDFEIFTPDSSEELIAASQENRDVFPHVMVYDDDLAVREAAEAIGIILDGGTAEDVLLDE